MRIRKGNEVEVWIQEAGSPVGAWRSGDVQWGNGHSYVLRWHDGAPDSGRISRKSVRPRPPPAPVPPDLDAGDLVEVLDEDDWLWKCAEAEVLDGGRQFRVKVVGAPKVLTVAPNRVRLRQMLRNDDVWVLLHKGNQIANGHCFGGNYKPVAPGINPLKQKRSPCTFNGDGITNDERVQGTQKKKLCVREEPRHDNVEVIQVPKTLLNKQDEIGSNSSSELVGTGSNFNHDDRHQQQEVQHRDKDDSSDSESVSSSDDSSNSDSSSGSSDSDDAGDRASAAPASAPPPPPRDEDHHQKAEVPQQFAPPPPPPRDEGHNPKADLPPQQLRENDHLHDTVSVSFGSWGRGPPPNDKKAAAREQVHRMELEAYVALTRAFHASGDALSWEKAELLTELRAHLHVSNDEHLRVINALSNRKRGRFGQPGNL